MAEYTPTKEQVRRYWQYGANAWAEGLADDRDEGPDGSIGAEFDRWRAAHDREVKAEALREAAQDARGVWAVKPYVDEWLDARADRIEKETDRG